MKRPILIALSLLVWLVNSCSQQPDLGNMVELSLSIKEWTSPQQLAEQAAQAGISEVRLQLQRSNGKVLAFDNRNEAADTGQESFSLSPSQPKITLKLAPATYVFTFSVAGKALKKHIETLAPGKRNLTLQLAASDNQTSSPSDPIVILPERAANLIGLAKVASIDTENRSFHLQDLAELTISTDASTVYFHESTSRQGGQAFWDNVKVGSVVALEAHFEPSKILASFVTLLPESTIDRGYFSLSGSVAELEVSSKTFRLKEAPGIALAFTDSTLYSNYYQQLSAEKFWSLINNDSHIMLEGQLGSMRFQVNSALLAEGEPPLPGSGLRGELKSFNAKTQELWLKDYEDIRIIASEKTLFYSDKEGELDSEAFFARLKPGVFIAAEGELNTNVLSAWYIGLMTELVPPPPPFDSLDGKILSVDSTKRTLKITSAKNPDARFSISVDDKTFYSNDFTREMTAESFWAFVKPDMHIYAEGKLEAETMKAHYLMVSKFSDTIRSLEGEVSNLDKNARQFSIEGKVRISVTKDTIYFPSCDSDACSTGSIPAEAFWREIANGHHVFVEGYSNEGEDNLVAHYITHFKVAPPRALSGEVSSLDSGKRLFRLTGYEDILIQVNEKTAYASKNVSISPEVFWRTVALKDFMMVEGSLSAKVLTASRISHLPEIMPLPEPEPLPLLPKP